MVEPAGQMLGVVTGNALFDLIQEHRAGGNGRRLADVMQPNAVVAHPDEPLRVVVYRMAETGFTRLPVVARQDPRTLMGIISLSDLLKARAHHLEEERRRERVLQMRLLPPVRARRLHKTG